MFRLTSYFKLEQSKPQMIESSNATSFRRYAGYSLSNHMPIHFQSRSDYKHQKPYSDLKKERFGSRWTDATFHTSP